MKVALPPVYARVPELCRLAERGIECDQILAEAIRRASCYDYWDSFELLYEIAVLSPRVIAGLDIVDAVSRDSLYSDVIGLGSPRGSGSCKPGREFTEWREWFDTNDNISTPTRTTNDFLNRLVKRIVDGGDSQNWHTTRPLVVDFLDDLLPRVPHVNRLSDHPTLTAVIHALPSLVGRADDIEFILGIDPLGRLCVRTTGVLGDFAQMGDSGILVPTRAMIVHQQTFGSFTEEQIAELEELINGSNAREHDFQNFFERNPHFFRHWDHRAVYPHVYLTREADGDGPLIPDFILTNRDAQQAFVVDLKLPGEKLIVRQKNRDRFSAAVMEAKAQLLQYRDWFDDNCHRERVKQTVGMEIYRPHVAIVIGRSTEFRDEIDRQKLRANEPGVEVVTYDDILRFARRRQLLVGTA